MNRAETIEKLLKEGFSETTLVKFNDNQLKKFADKILKEAQTVTTTKTVYRASDPKDKSAVNAILDKAAHDPSSLKNQNIEVVEDNEKESNMEVNETAPWTYYFAAVKRLEKELGKEPTKSQIDAEMKKLAKPTSKKNKSAVNLKNPDAFVESVVSKQYHSITKKSEIIEMVKSKMNTTVSEDLTEKKLPKLPEFLSFDSIVSAGKPEEAPVQPEVIPDTPTRETPSREDDPRRRPFRNPNEEPAADPDPKAKIKKLHRPKMSMAAE